jgi:hypothetical protein
MIKIELVNIQTPRSASFMHAQRLDRCKKEEENAMSVVAAVMTWNGCWL